MWNADSEMRAKALECAVRYFLGDNDIKDEIEVMEVALKFTRFIEFGNIPERVSK